jgi:hypothetical protein
MMSNRGSSLLAILAVVLFVPLFILRSLGSLDFWWWMSINITLLIALSFLLDGSYIHHILADLKRRPAWKIGAGVLTALFLYALGFPCVFNFAVWALTIRTEKTGISADLRN